MGSGLRFALLSRPCPRHRWRAAGVFAATKRNRFASFLCPRETLVCELTPNHVELTGGRARVMVPSWYWAHATFVGNTDLFCCSIAAAVRVVCHALLRLIVPFLCPHLAYRRRIFYESTSVFRALWSTYTHENHVLRTSPEKWDVVPV